MSTTLITHLQRIARQTRSDVTLSNEDLRARIAQGYPLIRIYTVRDFYRPAELVRMYAYLREL